ncbi:outer membrane protein TolC [Arcticibacter pallidicorallinus]|uniref:Outer membrane protein TolC n=1 Tax=Arcticibacter pallidicorallinus TaxID=1259464 RepID=A0A2T0U576_9SPHI|nr:TolC family protein [Arcticibacter pallidicorallinus]PRY53073.1 outer membrane protein TolC [Arcticibacter pallidicorallinus]
MKSKHIIHCIAALLLVTLSERPALAQQQTLTLQQAVDAALANNHLLKAKSLQIEEKKAKVKEDAIKKYPAVTLNSTWQYNANIGELVIPRGSFAALPLNASTVIQLPDADRSFELGRHQNFNAGATIYQPLTHQPKIQTGLEVGKTDILIAAQEKRKAALQIEQAVEKLYFGILINSRKEDELKAKLELSKLRLYDVESALLSGKAIHLSKEGLQASRADEEQELLKLIIQREDYAADLRRLTGIDVLKFNLNPIDINPSQPEEMPDYQSSALSANADLSIAELTVNKTRLALKAARQNYLPEVGIIAGYTYQQGNILYPTNNPFAGLNFKWNIQDLFANKQVLNQRSLQLQQAKENEANALEQLQADVEKAVRKISQAEALVNAAQKVLNFRRQELKVQLDKQAAGLNVLADVLSTRSTVAKAEADLYGALLNYRLAQSELNTLTKGETLR